MLGELESRKSSMGWGQEARFLALPPEILTTVVNWLDAEAKDTLPLVCRQLLETLVGQYVDRVTDLRLVLEDGACPLAQPELEARDGGRGVYVALCQCPPHVQAQAAFLHQFLGIMGFCLRSIIVEDFLLAPEARLAPATLDALVNNCPLLHTLELHDVDLGALPAKTIARIADLRCLRQLALADCEPGVRGSLGRISERLIASLLSVGLAQLILTRCGSVTDKSLAHVARACPNLWLADFSGCPRVTAVGVSAMCLSLASRVPDMLWLCVGGTDVCGLQLERLLHHRPRHGPNTPNNKRWQWTPIQSEVGYSYVIVNSHLPNKTIILSL